MKNGKTLNETLKSIEHVGKRWKTWKYIEITLKNLVKHRTTLKFTEKHCKALNNVEIDRNALRNIANH